MVAELINWDLQSNPDVSTYCNVRTLATTSGTLSPLLTAGCRPFGVASPAEIPPLSGGLTAIGSPRIRSFEKFRVIAGLFYIHLRKLSCSA
jgi:hypothetical protein